jgi:hypothetical protein
MNHELLAQQLFYSVILFLNKPENKCYILLIFRLFMDLMKFR